MEKKMRKSLGLSVFVNRGDNKYEEISTGHVTAEEAKKFILQNGKPDGTVYVIAKISKQIQMTIKEDRRLVPAKPLGAQGIPLESEKGKVGTK